jgi:hypothetical protein
MNWTKISDYSPMYGEVVLVFIPLQHTTGKRDIIFLARRKEVVTEKNSTDKKVKITIEDRYYEETEADNGYSFKSEYITHWMLLPSKPH